MTLYSNCKTSCSDCIDLFCKKCLPIHSFSSDEWNTIFFEKYQKLLTIVFFLLYEKYIWHYCIIVIQLDTDWMFFNTKANQKKDNNINGHSTVCSQVQSKRNLVHNTGEWKIATLPITEFMLWSPFIEVINSKSPEDVKSTSITKVLGVFFTFKYD